MKKLFNFGKKKIVREDYLVDEESSFALIESFRDIKANITFSVPKKGSGKANCIAITSASEAEGKSTVSSNLAATYARAGAKVLLIDCDMRRPRVKKFFATGKKTGLSNYLCGIAKKDEIIEETSIENLFIISGGAIPPNPNELLSIPTFSELLDELSSDFEYIFIDTPPLDSVSDCLLVAPHTDGLIIVARYKSTSHVVLGHVMEQLEFAKIKVLGFIMNDYNYKSDSYGYGKKYKYNYYYENRSKIEE